MQNNQAHQIMPFSHQRARRREWKRHKCRRQNFIKILIKNLRFIIATREISVVLQILKKKEPLHWRTIFLTKKTIVWTMRTPQVKATPAASQTSTNLKISQTRNTHQANLTQPYLDYKQSTKRTLRNKVKPTTLTASAAFQKKPNSLSQHGNRLFLKNMPSKILLLNLGHRTFHSRHPPHRSLPSSRSQRSRVPSPQQNRRKRRDNQSHLNRKRHSRS